MDSLVGQVTVTWQSKGPQAAEIRRNGVLIDETEESENHFKASSANGGTCSCGHGYGRTTCSC